MRWRINASFHTTTTDQAAATTSRIPIIIGNSQTAFELIDYTPPDDPWCYTLATVGASLVVLGNLNDNEDNIIYAILHLLTQVMGMEYSDDTSEWILSNEDCQVGVLDYVCRSISDDEKIKYRKWLC
eukprot:TRINITY_DN2374_c0_g1_i1.p1 TRINITY_DN2374_c0_g1~~TRINITY_DN2374_c0_g1_i1.p1  ORF type:complete len:127 (-),score=24.40 TRINITY_DN2374_c0_g1_i1:95-475(-)